MQRKVFGFPIKVTHDVVHKIIATSAKANMSTKRERKHLAVNNLMAHGRIEDQIMVVVCTDEKEQKILEHANEESAVEMIKHQFGVAQLLNEIMTEMQVPAGKCEPFLALSEGVHVLVTFDPLVAPDAFGGVMPMCVKQVPELEMFWRDSDLREATARNGVEYSEQLFVRKYFATNESIKMYVQLDENEDETVNCFGDNWDVTLSLAKAFFDEATTVTVKEVADRPECVEVAHLQLMHDCEACIGMPEMYLATLTDKQFATLGADFTDDKLRLDNLFLVEGCRQLQMRTYLRIFCAYFRKMQQERYKKVLIVTDEAIPANFKIYFVSPDVEPTPE